MEKSEYSSIMGASVRVEVEAIMIGASLKVEFEELDKFIFTPGL